ncbi:MAG: response regulator [Flavisolibacter sp.]|jgi:CheY-like chemotaxis protein
MPFVPTILCVDDDEDDLYFIREVIDSRSFPLHIEEAKNGSEAMAFLQDSLLTERFPCLVIMDMNMPRMNGKQTIMKMKENKFLARIPIVVFTTSTSEADRKYFEDIGVHFISKPFQYNVFTNQIIDLLAYCADLGT